MKIRFMHSYTYRIERRDLEKETAPTDSLCISRAALMAMTGSRLDGAHWPDRGIPHQQQSQGHSVWLDVDTLWHWKDHL